MFSGSFMLYLQGGAEAREADQDFRIPCRMSRQRRSQKAAGRRFTGRSVTRKGLWQRLFFWRFRSFPGEVSGNYGEVLGMMFWVPVSEYILEFVSHEEIRFPGMAGSAFRGVFGHCLRKECCVTGLQDCSRCQILAVCPYNLIFERAVPAEGDTEIRDDTAKPYIFETVNLSNQTSGAGERFSIRVKLFGVESFYMRYIINAMAAAGSSGWPYYGFPKKRAAFF